MAHILVIDDDASLRGLLAEALRSAGHVVTPAADGLEGAQLYRANPADVVLCDIVMRHSGLTLIRILKEQYPDIRIIAISGAEPHRLDYALASGALCALRKPFALSELVKTVEQVLALPAGAAAATSDKRPA
jgi:CheY-like chemotaxis protein